MFDKPRHHGIPATAATVDDPSVIMKFEILNDPPAEILGTCLIIHQIDHPHVFIHVSIYFIHAHDGSMVLVYMLTEMGYIDGILRHGMCVSRSAVAALCGLGAAHARRDRGGRVGESTAGCNAATMVPCGAGFFLEICMAISMRILIWFNHELMFEWDEWEIDGNMGF